MTPEKRVQNLIVRYLRSLQDEGHPIMYERRQAGGYAYNKGRADLYVVYDGLHVEIEVKKLGGKQSTLQEKFEAYCKKVNIPYILAESVYDVKSFFDQIITSD